MIKHSYSVSWWIEVTSINGVFKAHFDEVSLDDPANKDKAKEASKRLLELYMSSEQFAVDTKGLRSEIKIKINKDQMSFTPTGVKTSLQTNNQEK